MSIYAIYFSPTGGTEKIVTFIAEQFGKYQSIDLCEKTSDLTNDFSEEDLCIIGVPSFGGRVPAIALERIKTLKGNNANAILITVYGNRAYEDTLIELEDTLIEKNFACQAAIAAVAEHSIMHQFATGRPDQNDLAELSDFVQKIKKKNNNTVKSELLPVHVPGNRPYREYGIIPLIPGASHTCGSCGLCVAKCPTGAIPSDNPKHTDKDKCISCMRCISVCPKHARKLNPVMLAAASQKLKKACSGRKENELFL